MENICIICNSKEFNILLDYKYNLAVTSDNKKIESNFILQKCTQCNHIQKQQTPLLYKTIENIYSDYEAYYLNNGEEEQKIDENNKNSSRSKMLLYNIKPLVKGNGKILDIGTGSGVFLTEFSNYFYWDLYAQDVKDNLNKDIKNNKNFKKLYILKKESLPKKQFDIISAIHVFEHIFDIHIFLEEVKQSLTKDGFLLLQVPKIDENIFDIFIIDHISHFYHETIFYILNKYFKFVYFPKEQINREITILASDTKINNLETLFLEKIKLNIKTKAHNIINYLNNLDEKIAIFGTSPPALYCATQLNFKVEYFVDENKLKQNKKLYDIDIISPSNAINSIVILFPYSNELLQLIQGKYPTLKFIHLESVTANKGIFL